MRRKLWENLCSLYGVHFVNYLVPLFVLPYLAHTLGPQQWGALAFADAYAGYVAVLVEFGFGFSATREISVHRNDRSRRSQITAGVIGAQLMLGLAALAGTFLFVAVSPFPGGRTLIYLAFAMAAIRSFCPFWYFQGLESMRVLSTLNLLTAAGSALLIFSFVKTPGDAYLSLLIRAVISLGTTLFGFYLLFRSTPFTRPSFRLSWQTLRSGGSLFLFKSAASFYTSFNVILLGFLAPLTVVAWFSGAEKIARAAVGALSPITQAFYPRLAYLLSAAPDEANKTARLSVWLTISCGALLGAILLFGAPMLVRILLGAQFQECVPVLRILSLLPLLISGSLVLGLQWMLPLRLEGTYSRILLAGGAINVLLALCLVPNGRQLGMALSVVVAEAFVTAGVIFTLRRKRLDPWRNTSVEAVPA